MPCREEPESTIRSLWYSDHQLRKYDVLGAALRPFRASLLEMASSSTSNVQSLPSDSALSHYQAVRLQRA